MATPISVVRRLERKKEYAERRRQALVEALHEVDAELTAINKAQTALSQGRKPNLRNLLGEVRLSQKDYVLEAVRRRSKKGTTRAEIVDHLNNKKGLDISPRAVTTLLYMLRVDGLVEFNGEVWRPLS
jgi:predicted  nucleic acid-binding Zn-ribbon protein